MSDSNSGREAVAPTAEIRSTAMTSARVTAVDAQPAPTARSVVATATTIAVPNAVADATAAMTPTAVAVCRAVPTAATNFARSVCSMNDARDAARRKTRPRRWQTLSNPRPRQPTLKFSPTAWAKLLFLRDLGPTDVGGFGISAADDLLRIEDVPLVRQSCTSVTVHFDDAVAADFFDSQVDQGLPPSRFGRVWIHTHPGSSASAPSSRRHCRSSSRHFTTSAG